MAIELGWKRFSLEILVLLICYMLVVIYGFGHIIPVFRRGFFCDDESIRYADVGESVSELEATVGPFTLGLAVIILTEYFVNRGVRGYDETCYFICTPAPIWIHHAYKYIVGYLLAVAATLDIKSILSTQIGRLRPSFISRCQPDVDLSNCSGTANVYITNYTCMAGAEAESYARQSFISGHAATPACITTFVVIYIYARWNRQVLGNLLTAFLSLVLVTGTLIIGMTRITDNMHYLSDVIAGLLLGLFASFLAAKFVCGLGSRVTYSNMSTMDEDSDIEMHHIAKSTPASYCKEN